MHLIIDGYTSNIEKIHDVDFIYELLDIYPSQIGMTKLSVPNVSRYIDPKSEDCGVSGIIGLAESHISIHTFPGQSYINIDIFSCKEFDAEQAVKDLQSSFELSEVRSYLINRPNVEVGAYKDVYQ
ncbi:MAG: S-adenosylmethionine decarboxylase [Chloroflexota bacterium]|nr:S-adenosylmethionine decarboxylase [Chloroflexota bacterium]